MPGFSYRAPAAKANGGRNDRPFHSRLSYFFRSQSSRSDIKLMEENCMGEMHSVHHHHQPDRRIVIDDTGTKHIDHEKPSQSCGRGIIQDFKSTVAKHWVSEMTNFNTKTIAVTFFLFIAAISPAITFGAVYSQRTNNYIGAMELLLATAWCGMFYSLVSGMPMMINGGTGPVLTFQAVCYELSKNLDVPFLTFNAWVGIWVAIYMVLAAFVDLNRLIKYATRFTDEIFAFLIVSIFILDAIGNPTSSVGLLHYFNPNHTHHQKQLAEDPTYDYMTVALLSLILGFGTTFFAIMLRTVRYSSFCCNDYSRSVITDFAITISVCLWTILQHTLFQDIPTEELNVPDTFAPTFNCCSPACDKYWPDECPDQPEAYGRRSWYVDLTNLNGKSWVVLMAAGPAALAFILAFLDNGITWHIVNHPSNMITHGEAYNYDTIISALMICVNSIFGLPWLVASTVPCIMHISAMAEKTKDGVTTSIQESRLTGFFTHALILGMCFALNIIKYIPLPVLYGVFLFMGLVALPAQQFWQRILLFFQQPSMIPKTPYTEYLPLRRIHLFTIIQLFFFILLYVVKNVKAIAIAFPIMILLCIPVRIYLLPKIFTDDELTLLDGAPEAIEQWILQQLEGEKKKNDSYEDEEVDEDGGGLNVEDLIAAGADGGGAAAAASAAQAQEQEGKQPSAKELQDFFAPVVEGEDAEDPRQREKQTSVTSVTRESQYYQQAKARPRKRRIRQRSVPNTARERQISANSIDAFFATAYGVQPRPQREKQVSQDRSVDDFMERNGLRMPDPDAEINETDQEDPTSRSSADIDVEKNNATNNTTEDDDGASDNSK